MSDAPAPPNHGRSDSAATSRTVRRRTLTLAGIGAGGVAAIALARRASSPTPLPSLSGATSWLNTSAGAAPDVSGKVVLVNFWTLTCINWIRTAAYVRSWADGYVDDGLVVVGVHTPEFRFEHDERLIQAAVRDRRIRYPVAVDNDNAVWDAFGNHYWPASYFADRESHLTDHHFGEGDYEQSETTLQRLLGIHRPLVGAPGRGIEADADWAHLRSPETYLGSSRGGGPERQSLTPSAVRLPLNGWALEGNWDIEPEYVRLREGVGAVTFTFEARDAHLVLFAPDLQPVPFTVELDGHPPRGSHGIDVQPDGHAILRQGGVYHLVRSDGDVHPRTLKVTFARPGVQAYSFTFG